MASTLTTPKAGRRQKRLRRTKTFAAAATPAAAVARPSVTRERVELTTLAHPCYRLRGPLTVEAQRGAGGEYLVSHRALPSYGAGRTLSRALADFRSALVERYEELDASENTLSQDLRSQLADLRAIVTVGTSPSRSKPGRGA